VDRLPAARGSAQRVAGDRFHRCGHTPAFGALRVRGRGGATRRCARGASRRASAGRGAGASSDREQNKGHSRAYSARPARWRAAAIFWLTSRERVARRARRRAPAAPTGGPRAAANIPPPGNLTTLRALGDHGAPRFGTPPAPSATRGARPRAARTAQVIAGFLRDAPATGRCERRAPASE
jgi:hypothetical protein